MQCRNHPTQPAANTCNQCGSWLCEECTVDIQGRLFCRGCLAELSSSPVAAPPPSATRPVRISGGLLFLFSCFFPPGTNYMYMGLIKRGLATMSGFFLLIYMVSVAPWRLTTLFAFGIPILFITCIFDGFSIRRRINAGEAVPDGVGDFISTMLHNKVVTLIILGILLFTFVGSMLDIAFNAIPRIGVLLIIGLVLYVVFRRKPPTG